MLRESPERYIGLSILERKIKTIQERLKELVVNNMRICNDIKEQQKLRKAYSEAGYKYETTSRTRHRKGKYEYDKCIEMWWDKVNEEWRYIYYEENKKEVEY